MYKSGPLASGKSYLSLVIKKSFFIHSMPAPNVRMKMSSVHVAWSMRADEQRQPCSTRNKIDTREIALLSLAEGEENVEKRLSSS